MIAEAGLAALWLAAAPAFLPFQGRAGRGRSQPMTGEMSYNESIHEMKVEW
ncbi:MAG: hypothetical protein AABZ73_01565 [Pseudomonadota bacterium]|uniref:hypothetical protein n=1 Tax=Sphingobium sp. TaxID=1912891 RepID=UPI002E24C4CD